MQEQAYHLTCKTIRASGGASARNVYEQVFRRDIWDRGTVAVAADPRFGGAPAPASNAGKAELAVHAYTSALTAHTGGQVSVPKHVAIILALPRARSASASAASVRVSTESVAALPAGKLWIYIVEPEASILTMVCVGGMLRTGLGKAQIRPAFYEINTVYLDPTGFFDANTLEREASLPPVPHGVSSPCVSLIAASGRSPLLDYAAASARGPPTDALRHLLERVLPFASLADLLERRYEALRNITFFMERNRGVPIGAVGGAEGTAQQTFEAASIALFHGLPADDSYLQHCADVVSYWAMQEHVLRVLPRDGPAWRWFVDHETQLVTLRMSLAHARPGDFAVLLEPVAQMFGMERLAGAGAGGAYAVDIITAVKAGVPLGTGLGGTNAARGILGTVDAQHRIILSEEYVAAVVLPLWVGRAVAGHVLGAAAAAAAAAGADLAEENMGSAARQQKQRAAELSADPQLHDAARRIMDDRLAAFQAGRAGLYHPVSDADAAPPFDIEDAGAAAALFPPCAYLLRKKLTASGHLKFEERFAYTSFLLDLNYPKPAVAAHLRTHFTRTGGTPDSEFTTKYAGAVSRNEAGAWEGNTRSVPYGMACHNLIANKSGTDKRGGLELGCPFQRLESRSAIEALVTEMGVADPACAKSIADTARLRSNCQGACAETFAAKFRKLPTGAWRPRAPRTYYHEARRIVIEYARAEAEVEE